MSTPFHYHLPEDLIAQYPLKEREKARLMVINRQNGEIVEDTFGNIGNYFQRGDVLVLNDSRVIPARLYGIKDTGGRVEVFLLKKLEHFIWEVLLRGKIKEGQKCKIKRKGVDEQEGITVKILARNKSGSYMVEFNTDNDREIFKAGETPLPPYIKRKPSEEDNNFYQTVYAKKNGSVAAPTAGLHFTENLLKDIADRGVTITFVTLHIGWSSFKIIKGKEDSPGEEFMELSDETAEIINTTKKSGKKVIAVGTSVVRTLESYTFEGKVIPKTGYTDLFIKPGFHFNIVDSLITNFHLPGSTHLYLVCAFGGVELMEKAYKLAVEKRYKFYSYGDAMLII